MNEEEEKAEKTNASVSKEKLLVYIKRQVITCKTY